MPTDDNDRRVQNNTGPHTMCRRASNNATFYNFKLTTIHRGQFNTI